MYLDTARDCFSLYNTLVGIMKKYTKPDTNQPKNPNSKSIPVGVWLLAAVILAAMVYTIIY